MEEIKREYATFLSSKLFYEMFPFATGQWEYDKNWFIEFYYSNFYS